jgi:large subunit ribosomal protein L6
MSRVGNAPIAIPSGVTIDVKPEAVQVKGPKGQLLQARVEHVDVELEDGRVVLKRQSDGRQARSNHGLMRSLIMNMVTGVTTGFTRALEVNGVGFRADVRGKTLVLNLGFSHNVEYPIPDGIDIKVEKATRVIVSGIDKQQVGQVAAEIRGFRVPDHYKGKGVRYEGEHVRIKAGKSA